MVYLFLTLILLCGCANKRSFEDFQRYSIQYKDQWKKKVRNNFVKIYSKNEFYKSHSQDKKIHTIQNDEFETVVVSDNNEKIILSVNDKIQDEKNKIQNSTNSNKHIVKLGETIASIANEYGIESKDIINANYISEPYIIHPGRSLTIPKVKKEIKSSKLNVEEDVKLFTQVKMNFLKEYYPWDYDLLDFFDISLCLKFKDDMKKLSKLLSKKFTDSIELDQKSDGIFIRFNKKSAIDCDQKKSFSVEEKDGFATKKQPKKIYIYSMTSGKIVLVTKTEEFGTIVVIDSGAGRFMIYGYLDKVFLKQGEFVKIGASFASITTGIFNSPVLFLGIYKIEKGQRVFLDPMKCFDYLRRFFYESKTR